MARERRKWTAAEDELLKAAVSQGFESNVINWHAVASRIPGRTNKDCRKRWHYKVATNVNTGTWTAAEDKRLQRAVGKHGMKWALVATEVENRNGDQCSKRWKDSIDPDIDHSPWKPEEDQLLLRSVEQYGRNWKAISGIQFERRPPLALKNRYSLLQRHIGGSRPARVSRRAGPNNSAGTSRSTSANRYHRESEGDDIDNSMEGGSSSEGDYEISTDVETSRGSPFSQRLSVQSTVPLPGAKSGTPESESQDTRYRSPEHRSSPNFNPSSTDLLSLCSNDPMLDISDFNINGNMHFGTLRDSPNGTGNGIIPISASMLPIQSSSNSYVPTWDSVSATIHSTSQASDGSFEPQKPQAPALDSFQSSPSQLSPSHWSAALTESPRQEPNSSNRVSPSRRSGPTVLGSTREGDLRKQVTITAFCDPERIGKLLQVVMEAVNSVTNHEEDATVLLNVK